VASRKHATLLDIRQLIDFEQVFFSPSTDPPDIAGHS